MSNIYQYPQNLGDPDSQPASIQFQWFTRDKIRNSEQGDTVVLYMPQEAHQPSTTSWDSESFGLGGRAIYDKGRGRGTPGWKDAAEVVGAYAAGHAAQAAINKFGSNVNAENVLSAAAGQLVNPYLTMVFRGVDFRKFSFQFKFSPFHPSDATMIYNVVQSFRKNSLPTHASTSAFLGYPSECEIQYLWQGKPNPWLNQFKRSVCTKVDVNYTGQGVFAAMRDGFPASIVVDVEFTELDIVTADDILYANGVAAGGTGQSF